MTVSNLKDLSKLIDLCRKKGIKSISVDGVAIELGATPTKSKGKDPELSSVPSYSEEEILTWSVQNFEGAG